MSFATHAATEYRLSRDSHGDQMWKITVDRESSKSETKLVLRGAAVGLVKSQVQDLTCDGHPLSQLDAPATWLIPRGCRRLAWAVLPDNVGADASEQRSIQSSDKTFNLFSEASSLPRLVDASAPEVLLLSKELTGETFPAPEQGMRVLLPAHSEPPLFLLLDSKPVAEHADVKLRVKYFIDEVSQKESLPPIETMTLALRWLTSLVPVSGEMTFAYAWLGITTDSPSFGGATGSKLLLVNYYRGGAKDAQKAAFVPAGVLGEAAHQVSSSFGVKPLWVEESLSHYLGFKALQHAVPNDLALSELFQEFQSSGVKFSPGLIEIQRRVQSGDGSMYAAFFTKGLAFWAAVDKAIQTVNPTGLPGKLMEVWSAKYDSQGRPPTDFATRLNLPETTWRELSEKFLDAQ